MELKLFSQSEPNLAMVHNKTDTQKTISWIVIIAIILAVIGGVAYWNYGAKLGLGGFGFQTAAGLGFP